MKTIRLATTILLASMSLASMSAYADCSSCSGCNHDDANVESSSAAVMPNGGGTAEDVNPGTDLPAADTTR